MTVADGFPRLRSLSLGVRIGIAFLVLTMLIGFAASATHLIWHHENRDEQPGLSVDDVRGAYHGMRSTAPMLRALRDGHPEELPDADRQALIDWLTGDRLAQDYDNLDLGDEAPAEIIAIGCLDCHARGASDPVASKMPLEFWDDVQQVSISRDITPNSVEVLAASTHTHALSLSALSLVLSFLFLATSWPRRFVYAVICLGGIALFVDVAAQWVTREVEGFVYAIVIGGAAYSGLSILMLVGVLIDLFIGKKESA